MALVMVVPAVVEIHPVAAGALTPLIKVALVVLRPELLKAVPEKRRHVGDAARQAVGVSKGLNGLMPFLAGDQLLTIKAVVVGLLVQGVVVAGAMGAGAERHKDGAPRRLVRQPRDKAGRGRHPVYAKPCPSGCPHFGLRRSCRFRQTFCKVCPSV